MDQYSTKSAPDGEKQMGRQMDYDVEVTKTTLGHRGKAVFMQFVMWLSAVSWLYLFPSGITATSLIFISVVLHTSAQSLIEVRRSPGEHTDHINYYRNTTITLLKYLLHSYSNTTINGLLYPIKLSTFIHFQTLFYGKNEHK